ncbi:hypothetical protein I3842_12G026400 [Carya illinoinensis]|uniref:Uncharacterized protein n=1 Tax=Carya illinoinensis TaxID=32201 RepID=A0A922IVS0_CARIL|nr:hypothetical protein I3842_12G026400 [Carya illinoinensis]
MACSAVFDVFKACDAQFLSFVIEAWGLIRDTFIDPSFNHQYLDSKLQLEIFLLRSSHVVYIEINEMLSTLGDPFTQIISLEGYQSFKSGSDVNLQGVGLLINVEPRIGPWVVLACVEFVKHNSWSKLVFDLLDAIKNINLFSNTAGCKWNTIN